jgi:glyoxylase-like metal-dependent hydrolase (beta-lactamase superfamily II)
MTVQVQGHHDPATGSWTYLVRDGTEAAVVDPLLGFDPGASRVDPAPLDWIIETISQSRLVLRWILETHIHADHVSGAARLQAACGGRIVVGAALATAAAPLCARYQAPSAETVFDHLVIDGEYLPFGEGWIEAISTPGHTPACTSYRIGDDVFIGDTLFAPDLGSARCDFPGGNPEELWTSIQRLLALDEHVRLRLCHDYRAEGILPVSTVTVGEMRGNIHVRGLDRNSFAELRRRRDSTLETPRLMAAALAFNLRGGRLPEPDADGIRRLRVPLEID